MASSDKLLFNDCDRRQCRFCNQRDSPYTCPRCNFPYCSKKCYLKPEHSHCSEMFYKDWVETHLRQSKGSPSAQKKIIEILQRIHQKDERKLDSDDEGCLLSNCHFSCNIKADDAPDLHERLSGLNLDGGDDSEIWERLTEDDKQKFQRLIENGETDNLLSVWKPWWRLKETTKLVQEMEECTQDTSPLSHCPHILEDIPPMKELLSGLPSNSIKYHLINALYAYAYIAKFYNGDHHEFPKESVKLMMEISHCLSSKQTFSNIEDAVFGAICQLQTNKALENSPAFVTEIIDEVRYLLEGPDDKHCNHYILAALSDMQSMIKTARSRIKRTQNTPQGLATKESIKGSAADKEFIMKLRHAEKKLIFYMSWVKDYQQEMHHLILELNILHASKLNEMMMFKNEKEAFDHVFKAKISNFSAAKIEEI